MACGCGSAQPGEQWEVVNADKTVSKPMTKAEATQAAQAVSGSYIRQAGAAVVAR
jgi:hypothetical protein